MSFASLTEDGSIVVPFMIAAYFAVPALLARFVVGARWLQVLIAFPMFWLALFLLLGFGRVDDEVIGFTIIMSMFFSWLGVPIAALVAKKAELPYRFL